MESDCIICAHCLVYAWFMIIQNFCNYCENILFAQYFRFVLHDYLFIFIEFNSLSAMPY